MMSLEDCVWDIYDDTSTIILGVGLNISGMSSLMACGLVMATFLKSSLADDRSYWMILNLCAACLARCTLAGFLFSSVSAVAGKWIFWSSSCKFYGFLKQFTGVYQMEAVTHLCIERYVVAKYIKNGWKMTNSRYVIFISLCWMFSSLYSLPQLFGVGDYALDFSCTSCTLNLILPQDTWSKYILVSILLLQSVKPVIFIIFMLYWALQLESKCYNEKEHLNHILFTKSTIKVTCIALFFWAPTFVCTAYVIIPQLIEGSPAQPPLILAMTAAVGSELAPAFIVMSMIWTNERVRQATRVLYSDSEYSHDKNN